MEEVEHRSSLHDHCECDFSERVGATFVDDLGNSRSFAVCLSSCTIKFPILLLKLLLFKRYVFII